MSAVRERLPAVVAKVLSTDRLVINRGQKDGVLRGQIFIVYRLDAESIQDPATGEDLGRLELSKGYGKVIHVQEHLAILYNENSNFVDPQVGDFAKPI